MDALLIALLAGLTQTAAPPRLTVRSLGTAPRNTIALFLGRLMTVLGVRGAVG